MEMERSKIGANLKHTSAKQQNKNTKEAGNSFKNTVSCPFAKNERII
jgi:lambda repressor-like predicted transcriptional regulator